jgi:O-antigen/teichoic acid export membrane protein
MMAAIAGSGRYRAALLHFLAKAPFAIAASSLQGAVNYFIVVYLAYGGSLAATGEYRTLFSFYSLLGLASMFETNKVFIRSIIADDHAATTALFANRVLFSVSSFLLVGAAYLVARLIGWDGMPAELLVIAGLAAIIYPLDSYLSLLQARGRFNLLFLSECVKYAAALAAFMVALRLGASVKTAILAQLAAMALCHIVYFSLAVKTFIDFRSIRTRFRAMIGSAPARQARTYSIANILPASLEHVDKLLVGAVFGLEFLGVYTLAYSTGRFVYNTLKPALYIYYRRFVDQMPGRKLLRNVAIAFTLIGLASAIVFLLAIHYLPAMAKFASGASATVILFLSYGIGISYTIYAQAFALNKQSDAGQALRALALANLASLVLLGAALYSPERLALILLALQYPLREGLSIYLMARYRSAAAPT